MNKAIFYHAGCPVCVGAEQQVVAALDASRFQIKVVHLGKDSAQQAVAEQTGVKSVPALVLDGEVFHINYGASLQDLKGGEK